MSSLNPVFTVGQQIVEPLIKHLGLGQPRRHERPRRCSARSACPSRARRLAPIRTSSPAASSSG
jgi:peptide/nickel transport system ATP-binding protein